MVGKEVGVGRYVMEGKKGDGRDGARKRGREGGKVGAREMVRWRGREREWESGSKRRRDRGGILRFVGASTCIQCPVGTYTNTSGENVHILPRFFYIFLRRPELRT